MFFSQSKTAMPGMKHDCGGAAAVLGAFSVAVKSGFKVRSKFCCQCSCSGSRSVGSRSRSAKISMDLNPRCKLFTKSC